MMILRKNTMLSYALVVLATMVFVSPSNGATVVDIELQLLVDVSGSISSNQFQKQRDGYEAAFRSSIIKDAIADLDTGSIAVQLVYWSGKNQQNIAVDWTLVDSGAASESLADAIGATSRPFSGGTGVGGAIDFGHPLIFSNDFVSTTQIIDVSGDGDQNSGPPAASAARDAALLAGVDRINGLVIGGSAGDSINQVFNFYTNNVIGGTDAFVIKSKDFNAFADTVLRKIEAEIKGEIPTPEVPAPAAAPAIALGLFAFAGRRRRRAA